MAIPSEFSSRVDFLNALSAQNPEPEMDVPATSQFALANNSKQTPQQFSDGARIMAAYHSKTNPPAPSQAGPNGFPDPVLGNNPVDPNKKHRGLLSTLGSLFSVFGAGKRFSDHVARMSARAGVNPLVSAGSSAVGGILGAFSPAPEYTVPGGIAAGELLPGVFEAIDHAVHGDLSKVWNDPAGPKMTAGQLLASETGRKPNSLAYKLESGTYDMVLSIADDPTTYIAPYLKGIKAGQAINMTDSAAIDKFVVENKAHQRFLQWAAKVDSPARIARYAEASGARIPTKMAVELADAKTLADATAVSQKWAKGFVDAGATEPAMKALPGMFKSKIARALQAKNAWEGPHLFSVVPKGTLDLESPTFDKEGRRYLETWMSKAEGETRAQYNQRLETAMDQFMRGSSEQRLGFIKGAIKDRLTELGLTEDQQALAAQKGHWLGFDTTHAFGGELQGMEERPYTGTQLQYKERLPGYREARAAKALATGRLIDKLGTGTIERKINAVTGEVKALWLMRPAMALRVSMDEALASMATLGAHPTKALGSMANNWVEQFTNSPRPFANEIGEHMQQLFDKMSGLPGFGALKIDPEWAANHQYHPDILSGYDDAFRGPTEAVPERVTGEEAKAFERLYGKKSNIHAVADSWSYIAPNDANMPQHMRAWQQVLNYQLRQDPLFYEILRNHENPLQALQAGKDWLATEAGQKYAARLGFGAAGEAAPFTEGDILRYNAIPTAAKSAAYPNAPKVLSVGDLAGGLTDAARDQALRRFGIDADSELAARLEQATYDYLDARIGRATSAAGEEVLHGANEELAKSELANVSREIAHETLTKEMRKGSEVYVEENGAWRKLNSEAQIKAIDPERFLDDSIVIRPKGYQPPATPSSGVDNLLQAHMNFLYGNKEHEMKAIVPETLRGELAQREIRGEDLHNVPMKDRPTVWGYTQYTDVTPNAWARSKEGFHNVVSTWLNNNVRKPVYDQLYTKEFNRLKAITTASGALGNEIDEATLGQMAAKSATLDMLKVIHNPAEKTRFDVLTKSFIPFNYAYIQFIKRWGRAFETNPAFARRLQILASVGQHDGWFDSDERGNLLWHMPVGNEFFQHYFSLGIQRKEDLPFMAGPLEAFNKVAVPSLLPFSSHVMPGFSPIVTIPAAYLTMKRPGMTEAMTHILGPSFGQITNPGMGFMNRVASQIAPSWMQKFTDAVSGDGADNNFGKAYITALQYHGFKGDFERPYKDAVAKGLDLNSPKVQRQIANEQNKIKEHVKHETQLLFLVNSVESLMSPYAPLPNMASMKVPSDYRQMIQKMGPEAGAVAFLDKYGPKAEYYMQSITKANSKTLEPSKEYQSWIDKNGAFVRQYPNTAGFLAPRGPFNEYAYQEQKDLGERTTLTPTEWIARVATRRGDDIWFNDVKPRYDKLRAAGASSEKLAVWLNTEKQKIEARYPGWLAWRNAAPQREFDRQAAISELSEAVNDPNVPKGPDITSLRTFIQNYNMAKGILAKRGYTSLSSKKAAPFRAMLVREYQAMKGTDPTHPTPLDEAYALLFRYEVEDF